MNITSYIVFLQLLLGSISLPSFGGAGGGFGFNGGDDYLVISVMGDHCVTLAPIEFEPFSAFKTMPQGTELIDNSMATLKVTPNPSEILAAVSYNLGTEYQKAESIKIYAIDGRLVAEIAVEEHFGTLALDISHFPAGTYIITLAAIQ